MKYDSDSSSDGASRLRRIFAFHNRFAQSLSRFLFKSLEVDSKVSLVSVESGCHVSDSSVGSILFCAGRDAPVAALLIARSFLLGVIDRYLGNDSFTPGSESDSWSELDEELSLPFISRLFEILVGFCSPSSGFPFDTVTTQTDVFRPEGEWFTVNWNVVCGGETFSFSFFLPAELAAGEETLQQAEPAAPKTDEELLRYIEMRRATSEKVSDTESTFHPLSPSDQFARVRVLVGSFGLRRDDFDEMKPGDILATDIPAEALFTLAVNGGSVCHVKPGEEDGEKAVVIVDFP